MASNFSIDRRDIFFTLFDLFEVDRVYKDIPAYKDQGREDFEMILTEAANFATETIAPINQVGDKNPVRFENGKVIVPKEYVEAYRKFCENGWVATSGDPEFGGQGLPNGIHSAASEIFFAASIAFYMYPGLTMAAARLIKAYGTEEMKRKYVPRLYSGEWQGTMCLTEPSAGSAVGDLKSSAKRAGDHYLITGQKIFISAGEHDMTSNHIHLVLARVEGAPKGIKGVSLFLVPKYLVNDDGTLGERNDVQCIGVEHKMGIKASATCTLSFGENGKCIGYLIGEENKGIQYMFMMMNEARMGVGLQGLACASAAYLEALKYAQERIQGTSIEDFKNPDAPRVPIIKHPDVKKMLATMKAYTEGMRMLCYQAALFGDLAEHGQSQEIKDKYQGLLDLYTPIVKAYCSDMGFKVTELAVQTFGGYGYCSEYPVEQYLRDCKIASIYEGTNGIQAMDLLGRKISMKGGLLLMTFLNELNVWCEENGNHSKFGDMVKQVEATKNRLAEISMKFAELSMGGDMAYPAFCATNYLYMFGDTILGWLWVKAAMVAEKKLNEIFEKKGITTEEAKEKEVKENPEAAFYDAKIKTARFYLNHLMTRTEWLAQSILSVDRSGLDINYLS
jgi:alkylation response protein AidB-like acyl-CoA dehydrogenase